MPVNEEIKDLIIFMREQKVAKLCLKTNSFSILMEQREPGESGAAFPNVAPHKSKFKVVEEVKENLSEEDLLFGSAGD